MTPQDFSRLILATITPPATGGYLNPAVQERVIESGDHSRFLVIRTGWDDGQDTYAVIQDVELRDGLVLIHRNNTEDDLPQELVEAGIPASAIVKAYLSPAQPLTNA